MNRQTMRWIWTAIALANVAGFAILEGYALAHDDALTLSQYLVDVQTAWPPFGVVAGMVWGGLIVHLAWHWLPAGAKNDRG